MRTTAIGLLVVLVVTGALVLAGPPLVGAQESGAVIGTPGLSVAAPDNRFEPGEQRSLSLTVANAGTLVRGGPDRFEDRVTAARSVRIGVARDRLQGPLARGIRVDSGPVLLGELPGASTETVDLSVRVGQSVPPGTYQLPLRVTYEYTSLVRFGEDAPEYNDAERTVVLQVPVVVQSTPQLSLTDTSDDPVAPGNTGRYTFTVTNVGTEPATGVGLRLHADDVAIHLGGKASAGATTGVFVGDLDPGESRTVAVTLGAYESTVPGRYLLEVTAMYRAPGGFERTSGPLRAGVRVARQTGAAGSSSPSDVITDSTAADNRSLSPRWTRPIG
jgi:sialidase-1